MGYNDLSECTLTQDERVAEKHRIVSRLTEIRAEMTRAESDFVTRIANGNFVSVKQLYWLRDINNKY
jgi:hypothetical protein